MSRGFVLTLKRIGKGFFILRKRLVLLTINGGASDSCSPVPRFNRKRNGSSTCVSGNSGTTKPYRRELIKIYTISSTIVTRTPIIGIGLNRGGLSCLLSRASLVTPSVVTKIMELRVIDSSEVTSQFSTLYSVSLTRDLRDSA